MSGNLKKDKNAIKYLFNFDLMVRFQQILRKGTNDTFAGLDS
jgi:hypothetical protein